MYRIFQICLAIVLLIGFLFNATAQNLVPNPSFEIIDTCPHIPPVTGYGQGSRPMYWFSASDTPDYFNACVDSFTSVPKNIFGYQQAVDGQAYSGMATYLSNDFREMIAVELINPMVVGQTYFTSMYLNSSQGGNQPGDIGCNNVGMLFTTTPYHWMNGMALFPVGNFAHVYSQDIVADTLNWIPVQGNFVADSAYQFVVIGNHFQNVLTDTLAVGPFINGVAYHFIDQVCVALDSADCPLTNTVDDGGIRLVKLWPNPGDEELWISLPSTQDWIVGVYDVYGRQIISEIFEQTDRIHMHTVDWTTGEYILHVVGQKTIRSLKFVKL
jgi:hypothetical protein